MLLRMMYDDKLAQAAYLIGCQRTREALVIDPERDVDRYIDAAAGEGLRITAIAETHIHADFLSGARELAERTGARLYLSDEGGEGWRYTWLDKKSGGGSYVHVLLHDGDSFRIGGVRLTAIHTPGHTPEHLCFEVLDEGAGATAPLGIVTGDFVFVGDLGRPDLLETAAGQAGAKEPAARELRRSVLKFVKTPDFVQVWPGHGAGSACGKALGAVPQSTVGYEKLTNSSIIGAADEEGFVRDILSGQPEPPLYFARMKRLNRDGPPVLGSLPRPARLDAQGLAKLDTKSTALIDTRPWTKFRAGHIPGALSVPLDRNFPAVAGSYVREGERVALIVEEGRLEEAVRDLVRVGVDDVTGWAAPEEVDAHGRAGGKLAEAPEIDAKALRSRLDSGEAPFILDVRRMDEYDEGHIAGALNATHVRLPERIEELPRDRPIVVHCRSGVRSARATALLRRAGFDATNLEGGYLAWAEQSRALR
ncbi:MAG: MBL fold metallo-hydrolase [Phycisphaeraceae bacterium]|nr:MAG: MBL fold metallo-hydrolase [Phycisphaeraceae bacterium]